MVMDGASRAWLVVLAVVCLLLCCSSLRAVARPTDWSEVVGRLSPFAPQPRPTTPAHALDALAQAFVAAKGKRQSGGQPGSGVRPVVLIASMIGSRLQAQLDGYRSSHWYCWTEWREWFTIWFNFEDLVTPFINCWYEQMALHLDPRTGRSFSTPGVNIRYIDYGGVGGVTYLDDWHEIPMWNETVYLFEALGWEVGQSLRAAPYDWRFGPETWAAEDWPRLRRLIEETYALNNNTPVAAVSLSMGGPYFLGFLNQQTQGWKDKFLHSFISLDGAFGGSPSAASVLISTSGWWSAKVSDPVAMRALVQTWPSSVWMLPLAELYGEDYVWVTVSDPPRNYTSADFAQLLADSTGHNASLIFRLLQSQNWLHFEAPGVASHAFFGTNVTTPMRTTFATVAFDTVPQTTYGNGDGVVPEAGLRMLERWRGKQAQPIHSYPIEGLFHGTSVWNKQVLREVLEIITSP